MQITSLLSCTVLYCTVLYCTVLYPIFPRALTQKMTDWTETDPLLVINIMQNAEQDELVQAAGDILKM